MTSPDTRHEGEFTRRGRLALVLQEAFTAVCRLRVNRQTAADAESFRTHIKQLLVTADQDARRAGYSPEDVKHAIYALVVFVDESVLNSPHPMFANWPRRPMQEEIFGGHMGGEAFFQHIRELAARQDSEDVADLLEVYLLALLLGFKGRYAMGGEGEIRAMIAALADKIRRIRGNPPRLAPAAPPPQGEKIPHSRDPWIMRLGIAAIAAVVLATLLFFIFRGSLQSAVARVASL